MMTQKEFDSKLIAVLWERLPGFAISALQAAGREPTCDLIDDRSHSGQYGNGIPQATLGKPQRTLRLPDNHHRRDERSGRNLL